MPLYDDFILELSNTSALSLKPKDEYEAALDAILNVELDLTKFPKAIFDHELNSGRVFWSKAYVPRNWDQQSALAKDQPDVIIEFDLPKIKNIRNLAAEQRVKLGLALCGEDVLLRILQNNDVQLREYIQGKAEFGNFAPGNKPKGWDPTKADILDEAALNRIRQEAGQQLLMKMIAKKENVKHLQPLLTELDRPSADDGVTLNKCAQDLGFPATFKLIHPVPPTDTRLKDKIDAPLKAFNKEENQKAFMERVKTLDFNSFGPVLDLAEIPFKAHFSAQPINFAWNDQVTYAWARGALGAYYLEKVIPSRPGLDQVKVNEGINAGSLAELRLKLKDGGVFGAKDFIDGAISDESMPAIKRALLINFVSNTQAARQDKLDALIKAKNRQEFNDALVHLGVDRAQLGLITPEFLPVINQAIRTRVFELELDKCSPNGGHKQSPELKKVFNKLPVSQQLNLVGENNTHKVRQLVGATDTTRVKYYTGKVDPATDLDLIAKENQKIVGLRMIHNSEVAKILSGLDITLTPEKAKQINELLMVEHEWVTDLSVVGNYIQLVHNIKGICSPRDENDFYTKFNIDGHRTGLIGIVGTESSYKIKAQQDNNNLLFIEYQTTPDSPIKKLLGIVLCLEKTNDLNALKAGTFAAKFRADINSVDNLHDFLELYNANPNLKALLKLELTEESFKKLQVDAIVVKPLSERVQHAKDTLKAVNKARKPYSSEGSKIKSEADNIKNGDLYNAKKIAGMPKTKVEELVENYKDLSTECAIAIEVLLDNKDRIESALAILKENGSTRAERNAYASLKAELTDTEKELKVYRDSKAVFDDSITKLQNAETRKGHHQIEEDHLVVRALNDTVVTAPTEYVTNVAVNLSGLANPLGYRTLEPGQKETVHVFGKGNGANDTKEVGAYHIILDTSDTVVTRGGKTTTQKSGGILVLDKMPPKPETEPENAVRIAMTMAVDALERYYAKYGKAPDAEHPIPIQGTNPAQVQMIYFALLECGEKIPNFRYGKDAISVNTGAYDPSKSTKWHGGYTEQSYRNSVFHNKAHPDTEGIITAKTSKLSAWIKTEEEERIKREAAERNLKKEMQDLRKGAQTPRAQALTKAQEHGARELTDEEHRRGMKNG
ncbi:hypothetical protein [Legionella waltersii]|uniref:Interaptin n=1 Tax=Legionella waltersii TaxID=66969 RepID=A0A0W1AGL0_9GAMM|nr:hypothetical protein [Legionella waltersii]KTD80519.1 interaptin [Legionella waltersii]SNV09489.1 interaptin [Legionella waltersii]